jgi:hypothetical protein
MNFNCVALIGCGPYRGSGFVDRDSLAIGARYVCLRYRYRVPSHQGATMFSDLALSRRLERAEGYACAQFADARRRLILTAEPSGLNAQARMRSSMVWTPPSHRTSDWAYSKMRALAR